MYLIRTAGLASTSYRGGCSCLAGKTRRKDEPFFRTYRRSSLPTFGKGSTLTFWSLACFAHPRSWDPCLPDCLLKSMRARHGRHYRRLPTSYWSKRNVSCCCYNRCMVPSMVVVMVSQRPIGYGASIPPLGAHARTHSYSMENSAFSRRISLFLWLTWEVHLRIRI